MTYVDWASSLEDIREKLRDELSAGKYDGIEGKQFGWLWLRIPDKYKDRDDVLSQLRLFSLEAVRLFDPNNGAMFSTFLTHHLRLRASAWQQYLWQRSELAKNAATISVSFRDHSRPSESGGWGLTESVVASTCPVRRNGKPDATSLLSTPSSARSNCQLAEMLGRLSTKATEILDQLLAYPDQDRLLVMLRSRRYRGWMRHHLNLTDEQITLIYEEVRSKFLVYL